MASKAYLIGNIIPDIHAKYPVSDPNIINFSADDYLGKSRTYTASPQDVKVSNFWFAKKISIGGGTGNVMNGLIALLHPDSIALSLISSINLDLFGDIIYDMLKSEGIDTRFIKRAESPDGSMAMSLIWNYPDGTSSPQICRPVPLEPSDIQPFSSLTKKDYVILTSLGAMGPETVKTVFKQVSGAECGFCWAPGDSERSILSQLLSSFLPANQQISSIIMNDKEWHEIEKNQPKTQSVIREVFTYTFITQGKDGCHIYYRGKDKPQLVPAARDDATRVSTVGAGDATTAGICASFILGATNPKVAYMLGALHASWVIESPTTQSAVAYHFYDWSEALRELGKYFQLDYYT